ncbi:MAG: hypothetical protein R3C69_05565 [Geminicoccaceae bacterium]
MGRPAGQHAARPVGLDQGIALPGMTSPTWAPQGAAIRALSLVTAACAKPRAGSRAEAAANAVCSRRRRRVV